jgi:hypothetical protein
MFSAGPVQGELTPWRKLLDGGVRPTPDFKPMGRDRPVEDDFVIVGCEDEEPGEDFPRPRRVPRPDNINLPHKGND